MGLDKTEKIKKKVDNETIILVQMIVNYLPNERKEQNSPIELFIGEFFTRIRNNVFHSLEFNTAKAFIVMSVFIDRVNFPFVIFQNFTVLSKEPLINV